MVTEPGLQSVDSRRRSSIFHPDMSASTLKGCRRHVAGSCVFCSAVLSSVSARLLSSSEELQPASLKVPGEVITLPSLNGTLRPGQSESWGPLRRVQLTVMELSGGTLGYEGQGGREWRSSASTNHNSWNVHARAQVAFRNKSSSELCFGFCQCKFTRFMTVD